MEGFFMVIGENSPSTSKRHKTVIEAGKEAARLCKKEKQPFFLLQTINYCTVKPEPVEWHKPKV